MDFDQEKFVDRTNVAVVAVLWPLLDATRERS